MSICVTNLSKSYVVPERNAGLGAALRSIIRRKTREVPAVSGISLNIEPGEIVGLLGPNGAGKTTLLKMLSGLLYPTTGQAMVMGFVPWKRNRDYLRQITLVMGQRNQLAWDLPAIDSYEVNRAIYGVGRDDYRRALDEMTGLLHLEPLLRKPVRNLSLGERMKCEFAAALLHGPKVVFLDEPTLGLDVTAQRHIRDFVAEYNRRHQATVILTSHYMRDVEALCPRVIVIDTGRLLFDGRLSSLISQFSKHKTIRLHFESPPGDLSRYGDVRSQDPGKACLLVPREATARTVSRMLSELKILDFSVEDPPVEDVIHQVFSGAGQ